MRYLLNEIDTLTEMDMQPDMVVAVSIDRFGDENIILNVLLPFFNDRNIAMVAIKAGVNSMTDREAFIKAVEQDVKFQLYSPPQFQFYSPLFPA